MALATNPLLQALTAAKAQKASASQSAKAPDPVKNNASSFSDVYAKQASVKPASVDNPAPKPAAAKSSAADSKHAASDTSAADNKTVADNGNALPDKTVAGVADKASGNDTADTRDNADDVTDQVLADGSVTVPVPDPTTLVVAQEPVVAPVTDPAAQTPVVDPALLASAMPQTVPAPVVDASTTTNDDPGFDPDADPLEGLTAVQVALENKAQQSAQTSKATADASKPGKSDNANTDPVQALAGNLAALGDKPVDKNATESGDDKGFSSLIADGLKDLKGASGDTRVDNFADRLAALSQAAQVKTTASPTAPLLNQPLAMNQSGWTEGVVNRVMYLSSMNLKQADIQLEPAELGRLDIRVNMAADQQTQITFMSAHVGVRDALESQMSRLRDSFAQQGMGQVDVNVSDQSRGWQQQAQQQQSDDAQRGTGSSGTGRAGGVDGIADGSPTDPAAIAAAQPLTVVGSSAVDYYA
ncbi:flagellar hook-length control protein FliK [Pseudomonas huanghezhanensis]|uniref:flagellar hook-length control protein FliK n=1 Tax=Pseudomonas huanghezhanensis TaxID=3002903 RepID=UPI00228661BC|nr:flagellar hook-length control protein FliK [Pseudomonas sp. BSw22131]